MNFQTKILIIDDDKRLGKITKNVLSMRGYDVCIANNGALGIQKAFEYKPNVILCNINMLLLNGSLVYNVLKASSVIDYVPFIGLSMSSDYKDVRFVMDLGADDYFVSPFEYDDLVRSIEIRLDKFRRHKEIGLQEFTALFQLTPNGIFLFDEHSIFEANPALLRKLILDRNEIQTLSVEDILDSYSYQKIKLNIAKCSSGILDSFSEKVSLVATNGQLNDVMLFVSAYRKHSGNSLMIALVTPCILEQNEHEIFVSDILKILKNENVVVSESLSNKLIDIFKQYNINLYTRKNEFFTYRETQILSLSMEGHSIKIIASMLSISDRTVEKHRANLMEKTGSHNIIEVIVFALRNNLIDVSPNH